MEVKMTRDGRNKSSPWVVRWRLYDLTTGNCKWRQKAFKYKAHAQQFREQLRSNELDQDPCSRQPPTLSEFRKQWLETRALRLKPATIDLYTGTFHRLEEFFGKHKRLTDIGPQDAERFVMSQKSLAKGQRQKPLSQATTNQIVRNCRTLFATAIRWELTHSNPFAVVDLPRLEQRRFHRFTPHEEEALLTVAPTLRHKALYDVLLTTGARLNEVLSRTWADLDFANGTLTVSNRPGTNELPPFTVKTKRQRTIPLSPATIDILVQMEAEAPENVPYVFLTSKRYETVKAKWQRLQSQGRPWKDRYLTNNVLRDFKAHCRKAGIRPTGTLCLHTLRKNTGQTLADAGLPINVIQAILGHSDPRTTLQYYSQIDAYHHKQVSIAFERRRSTFNHLPENGGKKYVSGTYDAAISQIHD